MIFCEKKEIWWCIFFNSPTCPLSLNPSHPSVKCALCIITACTRWSQLYMEEITRNLKKTHSTSR
ncbi:hypothetical protein I7I48_05945 [Histoplasma ohiense]|nr:hypothetical protein I7I48_05945 [Histoplasma ohiense (nom. inval.)]